MKISRPDFGHPYTKENTIYSTEISGSKSRTSEKCKRIEECYRKTDM